MPDVCRVSARSCTTSLWDLFSAELYDPSTGTWSPTGNMATTRWDPRAKLLAAGQVLVAGGTDGTADIDNSELYDPTTGIWTLTGNLNISRYDAFAMLLPGGDVLLLDGHGSQSDTAFAGFYGPSTGAWTLENGGNETPDKTGQTLTRLRTGIVLTCGETQGAYPHTTVSTACDLLDPSTGNDVLTGSKHAARNHHTATVLQNSEVLAAGGESEDEKGNLFYTNSAQLYTP